MNGIQAPDGSSSSFSTMPFYKYVVWQELSGRSSVSFFDGSDSSATSTQDFFYQGTNPTAEYCSASSSVTVQVDGVECNIQDSCFTTVNLKAYAYAFSADAAASTSSSAALCNLADSSNYAVNRIEMTEAFSLTSFDLNGDSGNGFQDMTWGVSTYINRETSEANEKFYYDLSGSVSSAGSTYQMCFSSAPPPPVTYMINNASSFCDYGCAPYSDCTEPTQVTDAGFHEDDVTLNDVNNFYATVMVIQNVVTSEHKTAFAFGHPPTGAAASIVPSVAIVAALATLL